MTYGTYTTIKQALEALNIRENIVFSVVNGEVRIFDIEDYIDTIRDGWEDELRDAVYQNAYGDGYSEGFKDGKQVARDLDQSDL